MFAVDQGVSEMKSHEALLFIAGLFVGMMYAWVFYPFIFNLVKG